MKIIILDRDGVINQDSTNFIKNESEWIPIPGSLEAIAKLCKNGYTVTVCTNQSGIGRNLFTLEDFENINRKMNTLINSFGGVLSGIFYCPHTDQDNCYCRKPRTGMILDIIRKFNIDNVSNLYMVGDSLRDLIAINAVGGKPVLVKTGKGNGTVKDLSIPSNTLIFNDLYQFTQYLLKEKNYETQ